MRSVCLKTAKNYLIGFLKTAWLSRISEVNCVRYMEDPSEKIYRFNVVK